MPHQSNLRIQRHYILDSILSCFPPARHQGFNSFVNCRFSNTNWSIAFRILNRNKTIITKALKFHLNIFVFCHTTCVGPEKRGPLTS